MKKRSILAGIATLLVAGGLLTGCGNQKQSSSNSSNKVNFATSYNNKGELKKGGTLKVGLVDDDPFKGIFVSELSSDLPTVMRPNLVNNRYLKLMIITKLLMAELLI